MLVQKFERTLPHEHRNTPWTEHIDRQTASSMKLFATFCSIAATVAILVVVWAINLVKP